MTPGQYKKKAKEGFLKDVRQTEQSFQTGRESWYVQAEEFGFRRGIELQNYHLSCIRRGKAAGLMYSCLTKLYDCENVLEMLDLNKDYFLTLVDAVAKLE